MSLNLDLFAVLLTLAAYEIAEGAFRASGKLAIFNPLLTAVLLVVPCLKLTGISYDDYFKHAQLIHFMLGPTTVALAVPLYEQRERVRQAMVALAASVTGGAVTGVLLAGGTMWLLREPAGLVASIAPKSVTTPVAMALSQQQGGTPALTAGLALVTGIFGAITAPAVLTMTRRWLGQRSAAAQGFALGMCAHGAGAARAFQDGNESGAFSGVAIGLNGLATAVLIPVVFKMFHL